MSGPPPRRRTARSGSTYSQRNPIHDDDYPHPAGATDPGGLNQCTSFAAWRVTSRDHVDIAALAARLGNSGLDAKNWNRFQGLGVPLDGNPAGGSGGVVGQRQLRHVAFVRSISADGKTMIIEDYNEDLQHPETYNSWVVPTANSGFTGFLHFERYARSATPPAAAGAPERGRCWDAQRQPRAGKTGGRTVTTNPGGTQGSSAGIQGSSGAGLQGSSGSGLEGGSQNLQGSGPGSGSPNTGSPSTGTVTLAQGDAAPHGYWYDVTLSGFGGGTSVQIPCADSVDPSGFHTVTVSTDGSGAAHATRPCYSGDGPQHWVITGGGQQSNRVSWASSSAASGGTQQPPAQQPPAQQPPVQQPPAQQPPAQQPPVQQPPAQQPVFTVMNTSETLPDGIWFRNSPHTSDTSRVTGLGVYQNERVQLRCYAYGDAVGPYNDTLWYSVTNVSRPTNGGAPNQGFLNAHYIDDGQRANAVDAGVPAASCERSSACRPGPGGGTRPAAASAAGCARQTGVTEASAPFAGRRIPEPDPLASPHAAGSIPGGGRGAGRPVPPAGHACRSCRRPGVHRPRPDGRQPHDGTAAARCPAQAPSGDPTVRLINQGADPVTVSVEVTGDAGGLLLACPRASGPVTGHGVASYVLVPVEGKARRPAGPSSRWAATAASLGRT